MPQRSALTAVPGADDPMQRINRNVTVGGRRTSVTLERIFWDALADMARAEGITVRGIVERIYARNGGLPGGDSIQNLTSALRVAVTAWYRSAPLPSRHSRAA